MDEAMLTCRAQEADASMRRARSLLVNAIREADADGMSQRQIARAVNRSQPEVNRLLRFHGDSPAGLAVRRARPQIMAILESARLGNPRIFGSTARGEDTPESDIDLLVTAEQPLGLMALSSVERDLAAVVGRPVDLVLDHAIRPDLKDAILESAVRL